MDKITLSRIENIHPKLYQELLIIYEDICQALTGKAICRFTHTYRSFQEQDKLFLQRPKVTNAKGGQSYHNYGLAVDICLIINGKEASWDTLKDFDGDGVSDWMEVVSIFKKYGWFWGGDFKTFKDRPHFEKTFGLQPSELLKREKFLGKNNLSYPRI